LEFLFEILAELLLQFLFETLAEIGFHSLKDTVRAPRNPILSTIGFFLWGLLAGGISLWPFPASFINAAAPRILNLAVTPVAAGLLMLGIGQLRLRRGHEQVGLDRFGYAFVFAFAMALVRFVFAK
jgi:hypothetical protein